MAKVKEMTRSTLMPIRRAVGLSNEVARMATPILVRRTMNCSRICTRMEAAMMMRTMLENVIALAATSTPGRIGWMPSCTNQATTGNGAL